MYGVNDNQLMATWVLQLLMKLNQISINCAMNVLQNGALVPISNTFSMSGSNVTQCQV